MANQKITDLVNLPANKIHGDDLLVAVDVSSLATPTGESIDVKMSDLAAYVTGSTDINNLTGYPLSASLGGSGINSPTIDSVLVGNGTGSFKEITGTNGHFLRKNPTTGTPEFTDVSNAVNINQTSGGPLNVNNGGTGRTSLTNNAVLFGNGTGEIGLTNVGQTNQVLAGRTGDTPYFVGFDVLLSQFLSLVNTNKETITGQGTFSVGSVVRKINGGYSLARADSIENSQAIGIVESSSTDSFTIVYSGKIDFGSNSVLGIGINQLVDGKTYWLSVTQAGQLVETRPSVENTVYNGILIATGTNTGIVVNWGPVITKNTTTNGSTEISTDSSYRKTFLLMGA